MVRFFTRPARPHPDDLCLIHSPPSQPPLFRSGPEGLWISRRETGASGGTFLGEVGDRALWALEAEPQEFWVPLRTLLGEADPDQVRSAVRAIELAHWAAESKFCGACGTPTRRRDDQTCFECPACERQFWPRVVPAVIMLVHRGDEVLLAQHTRHTRPGSPAFHTTLAGFVEAGETLEEAVAREVAEEVGVTVGPPVYVASQAWPFPYSLMVGFHAPWVSGEPVPDGDEISAAGWYRAGALPTIPPPLTIARRLIDAFFASRSPRSTP